MILKILTGVAAAFQAVATWLRWRERKANEQAGALKQQNADLKKANATKDRQLKAASKPRASRGELLKRGKARKRGGSSS